MNSVKLLFIAGCFASASALAQSKMVIAFGSCSDENRPQELWNDVTKLKPVLWIWGGDNIYADSGDTLELKRRYARQRSDSGYQRLLSTAQITGTWDDHDYGMNDGGKYWTHKDEAKKMALRFLGIPASDPVWSRPGIYNSLTVGKKKERVKILNLDTRYFRDTIMRVYYKPEGTEKKEYKYDVNPTGDVLGEAQWKWLEEELKNSDAALNIINSSIQVLSQEHRFEKWGNLPAARERLLKLIAKSGKRVLIISGDRHIAEISKVQLPGYKYTLYDFTSSGITHTWPEKWREENKYRVGELIVQKNFGLLLLTFAKKELKVEMEVHGKDGVVYLKETALFKD